MKTKRAIGFELSRLTDEQLIIVGHLTYHAGKLWNQANYLVQNRLAKPYYKDLYHKLEDNSIQCRCKRSKEHLRKFKKVGLTLSLQNAGIGVAGRVNLPRGIRTVLSCQTPRGAPSYRAE